MAKSYDVRLLASMPHAPNGRVEPLDRDSYRNYENS